MKPPIFVRSLTDQERSQLRTGLRSREAFTLRRCQIVLAISEGQWPSEIAATVGCTDRAISKNLRGSEAGNYSSTQSVKKWMKAVREESETG